MSTFETDDDAPLTHVRWRWVQIEGSRCAPRRPDVSIALARSAAVLAPSGSHGERVSGAAADQLSRARVDEIAIGSRVIS